MFASFLRRGRLAIVVGTGLAVSLPSPSMAQTYGADQGTCDRGALSNVLSTSTGNLLGSAAGAALGGLVGSQFGKGGGNTVMTITGVLAGALAGGYIGRQMDPVDQACVGRALESTPTNQTIAWQNPEKDSSYWVTPTRTYKDRDGTPCREYITNAVIDGQRQHMSGTACRQPDGSWKLEDEQGAASGTGIAAEPLRSTSIAPLSSQTNDRYDDASEFRRYSDHDLRDEYRRLNEQVLHIQQEQELLEREMNRRGIRR
jgi:surface antigen